MKLLIQKKRDNLLNLVMLYLTTTTTTTERLNSLCIKRHVLKGGINDFYRVKSEKKFQARQMLQEHLINQVQERFISKEDTRL